jgi:hypothetical protein
MLIFLIKYNHNNNNKNLNKYKLTNKKRKIIKLAV